MRLVRDIAVVAIVAFAAAAPAFAADFLKAIEDVPLPKGVSEQGDALVFESEQGRVVKASAQGDISAGEVASFYKASLPALGWKLVEGPELVFEREKERLTIAAHVPAGMKPVAVSFELVVKIASTKLGQ